MAQTLDCEISRREIGGTLAEVNSELRRGEYTNQNSRCVP
jgi:hypothetical protein